MIFETMPMGKILKFFFEEPNREVYLRELAKHLNTSLFTTKKCLDRLVEEGLILERKNGKMRIFKANMDNLVFKNLKKTYTIEKILKSGLIDFLKEKIPLLSSIVLYGSAARGEDTKNSDLDFLIIGKKTHLSLDKFKIKLGREINILIYKHSEWKEKVRENKGFYQNLITEGIVFYGTLPMVE